MENSKWIEAIMLMHFDLEEGQVVDYIYPHGIYTESFQKKLSFYSFPDTYIFQPEGNVYYCFSTVNEQGQELYCYTHFTQKKDTSKKRGYYQKSIVLISRYRLIKIFQVLLREIRNVFFQNEQQFPLLQQCFETVNQNENPKQKITEQKFKIKFFDKVIKVLLKEFNIMCFSFLNDFHAFTIPLLLNKTESLKKLPIYKQIGVFCLDVNIFSIFGIERVDLLLKLWEVIILNKSLLVLSDSPDKCSQIVYGLLSNIYPLQLQSKIFPYFTIFDSKFKFLKDSSSSKNNLLIGATNPLIQKVFLQELYQYTLCVKI